jgi:hypothetical protein
MHYFPASTPPSLRLCYFHIKMNVPGKLVLSYFKSSRIKNSLIIYEI